MAQSSRFAVAIHVLTLLAYEEGKWLTSDYIAGSVNTNPVVIRRILTLLSKAGFVSTAEGTGGGTVLACPAGSITLADVCKAVEVGAYITLPPNDPNPHCPVGRCVQMILGERLDSFQKVIERAMSQVTVDDILDDVKARTAK